MARDPYATMDPIEAAAAAAEARDAALAEGMARVSAPGAWGWQHRQHVGERIGRGHDAADRRRAGLQPAEVKDIEKREALAAGFVPNEAYERFLAWKANDDPRFDRLDAATRTALGYYQAAKQAAKEAGRA